ncbi:MAG: dihydrofolate reductase family protein [Streptosporangiaceae bacterium]|jgi:dihydrofolate reductase
MGKIIISETVSLDGVAGGERLFGWVGQIKGDAAKALFAEAMATEAMLLGRNTYGFFASQYGSMTGPMPDRLNSKPKYIVSSTLENPEWNNSTVLAGDVVNEVTKLKQQVTGDIVVYGSLQLVNTLIEHDLADEVRLTVYPVVLGAGERLFGEITDTKPLRLVNAQTIDDGLTSLTYEVIRGA